MTLIKTLAASCQDWAISLSDFLEVLRYISSIQRLIWFPYKLLPLSGVTGRRPDSVRPAGREVKKPRDQNRLALRSEQRHTFRLFIDPATVGSNTTVIGTVLEFSFSFVTISLCGIQFTARIFKHHRLGQTCYWPLPSEACLTPSLGTITHRKS